MTVYVNNRSFEISEDLTIDQFLSQHLPDQPQLGVAIALNNQVIPKDRWSSQSLQNKDKLTIITATQGG